MRQSFNTIRNRASSVALASLITTSAAQANTYEETLYDMDEILPKAEQFQSYRDHDVAPEAYDITTTTTFTGNTWKSLDIPNVTAEDNRYITFDFKANTEAEIQALLLFPAHLDINEPNDDHDSSTIIRLQGTQDYWQAKSPIYSQHGDWQSFTIPLTDYVSAGTEIDQLVFINDDDQNAGAHASFKNLRIYEEKENQNPVTGEDNLIMQENSTAKIDVLANDFDPDGHMLTISDVRGAINGSAAINADNTVTFTPSDGFFGNTSFEYVVSDGNGGTNFQIVNVSVLENNDDDGGSDPGTGGGSDGGSNPDTTHYSLTTEFLVCDTNGLCSESRMQVHDVEKNDQNDNTVTLSWVRPHRRENGDCLPPEELEIYHGSYETDTGLSQDFSFYTSEAYCDLTGDVDLDCNLHIQRCEKDLIIE